jgi:hypothetical protein
MAERARALSERLERRVWYRRYVPATAVADWERLGWLRTGAVTPGPFNTELYELTREDSDLGE